MGGDRQARLKNTSSNGPSTFAAAHGPLRTGRARFPGNRLRQDLEAVQPATGTVTGAVKPRHRHQECLAFLKQVTRAYPDHGTGRQLHLVTDNYAAHKHPKVKAWLAANPPSTAAPSARSRPQRQDPCLRRRLERALPPLVWTKTAEQILNKTNRKKSSNAGH